MKFFEKIPFPFKINSFRKAEETPSEGNFVNSDGNLVERSVLPSFKNGTTKPLIVNAQGERVHRVKNPSFSGQANPFFVNQEGEVVQAATLPSYATTEGKSVDALASPLFVNKKNLPVTRARNPVFLSDEEIVHASPRNVSNFYSPSVTGKQAKTSRAVDEIRAEREQNPRSANEDGIAVDPMIVPLYEKDENGDIITALRRDSFGPYSYMQHNDSDYVGSERRLIGAQGNWGEEGLGPVADDSEFASPTATRAEMLARILREEYLKREYLAQQGEKIGGLPFSPLATSARYYASNFDAKNMSANNSQGQSPRMWAFREMMQLPDNREEQKDWRHMTTESPTPNSGKPYDLGESFRNSAAQDIADMIEAHLRATGQWPENASSINVEAFKQGPSSRNFQAQKTKKAEEKEEANKLKNSFSNIPNEEIINRIELFRDYAVRSMWENPDHLRNYEAAGEVLLDRLNESLKDDDRSEISLDDLDTEGMDEEDIATWHAMANATNERLVHYFSGHYPDFVHNAALSEISFRLQSEGDEPSTPQPPTPQPPTPQSSVSQSSVSQSSASQSSASQSSASQSSASQPSVSTNSFESIMNKFGHVKGTGTNLSDQEINSLSPEEFDVYSEALMDGSLDTWLETNTPTSSNNQAVSTPKIESKVIAPIVDPDADPDPDNDEFLPVYLDDFADAPATSAPATRFSVSQTEWDKFLKDEAEEKSRREKLAAEQAATEDYSGRDLRALDFSGKDLTRNKFIDADMHGVKLSNANLTGVDLSKANLSGANLSGANLSGANLGGVFLWGSNLNGANLNGANLNGVSMWDANLIGANLTGANLTNADLSDSNLSEANLSEANLSEANLSGIDLSDADLRGANLTNADLRGVDLRGVDLRGAYTVDESGKKVQFFAP